MVGPANSVTSVSGIPIVKMANVRRGTATANPLHVPVIKAGAACSATLVSFG